LVGKGEMKEREREREREVTVAGIWFSFFLDG
jgi:hypothetical protein